MNIRAQETDGALHGILGVAPRLILIAVVEFLAEVADVAPIGKFDTLVLGDDKLERG